MKKKNIENPTVEEAIDAIIDQFTEEQLQQLEFTINNKKFTFKQKMLVAFKKHDPIFDIETIKLKTMAILAQQINENCLQYINTKNFESFFKPKRYIGKWTLENKLSFVTFIFNLSREIAKIIIEKK